MNRSRNNNNKFKTLTQINNKNISHYFFIKYLQTGKYQCINQETSSRFSPMFKYKFENHYNGKFQIIYKESINYLNICVNNLHKNYEYTYLTYNTKITNPSKSVEIGKIPNTNKTQYINLDYKAYTTKNTDVFFEKSNLLEDLEVSNNIENLLLKSNKIPTIEEKLNRGFEFFSNCVKYTQKFQDCYHNLAIEYGPTTDLIINL
jgi:hypothetical protein